MGTSTYELSYNGNKRIEQQSVHFCRDCSKKLSSYKLTHTSKYRSITCSGCSKTLRESAEGKETPDYSSALIILLENANTSGLITRITRTSDVQTKLDGAVKISRAVVEAHDIIQLHLYSQVDSVDMSDTPESNIKQQFPSDYNIIQTINQLPNFEYKISREESEDYVDFYILIYHNFVPNV